MSKQIVSGARANLENPVGAGFSIILIAFLKSSKWHCGKKQFLMYDFLSAESFLGKGGGAIEGIPGRYLPQTNLSLKLGVLT